MHTDSHEQPAPVQSLNLKELEVRIQKLQEVCQKFDPYTYEISLKTQRLLREFALDPFTMDPLYVSNQLLVFLDEAEHRLQQLKASKS